MIRFASSLFLVGLIAAPAVALGQGAPCVCHQGAQEICNGCDDNCNGVIDEACIPMQRPLAVAVPVGQPVAQPYAQPVPPPVAVPSGSIEVTVAPPPMRAEQQSPMPGPGHVWVGGYWNWNGSQYAWTPGQWQAPPQQGQVWEAPQWRQYGDRWRFGRGGWRARIGGMGGMPPQEMPIQQPQPYIGQPQGPIEVTVAPPPMRAEQQTPMPGPGYMWVAGYWNWNGSQYAWTPGQWQAPPQQGQVWEAPQWRQYGDRWRFGRGGWRARMANDQGMMQPQPPVPVVQVPQVQIAPPVAQDVMMAPPRMRFERRPPPPGPGYVWIGGYWGWNGSQHAWTAGQWQAPPQQGQTWSAPQWQHRGRGWRFRQGGWNGGGH